MDKNIIAHSQENKKISYELMKTKILLKKLIRIIEPKVSLLKLEASTFSQNHGMS